MFKSILEKRINQRIPRGLRLTFENFRLSRFNKVVLTATKVYRGDHLIGSIHSIEIIIRYLNLLKGAKVFYKVKMIGIDIDLPQLKENGNERNNAPGNNANVVFEKFFKIITNIFASDIDLEVLNCLIRYKTNILFVKKIHIGNKSIVLHALIDSVEVQVLSFINCTEDGISFHDSQITYDGITSMFSGNIVARIENGYKGSFRLSVQPLKVSFKGFCDSPILIEQLLCDGEFIVNSDYIEVANFSISLDDLPISFIFKYRMGSAKALLFTAAAKIDSNNLNFIKKCFSKIFETLVFSGEVTLLFHGALDLINPNRSKVKFEIQENTLAVKDHGVFSKLLSEGGFKHRVKKDGVYLRILDCSENNPNYLSIREIPPSFINLLVFCEDPRFFFHNGIDSFFIGRAIAINFQDKRFKLGASTITMQLIRNLFLNGNKNMVRKIEEALYAVLVENILMIPKNMLLELYLNVIEFGPNIYGIKEAADYYFGKAIADLSLSDYIVLTYIIRKPVFFNDALIMKSEQVKKNLKVYFADITSKLVQYSHITKEEYSNLSFAINFNGDLGSLSL